jgi:hypothetical protein
MRDGTWVQVLEEPSNADRGLRLQANRRGITIGWLALTSGNAPAASSATEVDLHVDTDPCYLEICSALVEAALDWTHGVYPG